MSISDESKDRQICCSFCGKPQEQARRLIAGPGVYICDECISVCADAMMRDLGLSVPGHDEAAMAEGFSQRRNRAAEAGGNQGQIR